MISSSKMIDNVIRTVINSEFPGPNPQEQIFDEKAGHIRDMLASHYPISDKDFLEIKTKIKNDMGGY